MNQKWSCVRSVYENYDGVNSYKKVRKKFWKSKKLLLMSVNEKACIDFQSWEFLLNYKIINKNWLMTFCQHISSNTIFEGSQFFITKVGREKRGRGGFN